MNREILIPFKGKTIKLVLNGNFCLTGVIDDVYDDAILFSTNQKTSLIHFDRIREITPMEGIND
jgi:hypothetical protein